MGPLGWYHPLRCIDMYGVNKNVSRVVFVQKLSAHQSLERCTSLGCFLPLLESWPPQLTVKCKMFVCTVGARNEVSWCCLVLVEYSWDFFPEVLGSTSLKMKSSFSQRILETPSVTERLLRARVVIDKEHQRNWCH